MEDARHVIASWAARSLVQYLVVERIAIITWQTHDVSKTPPTVTKYDYGFNFISDLGANACQTQDSGTNYERWICSPLFPVVDLSFLLLGVGVLTVAALITSEVLHCPAGPGERERHAQTRLAMQPLGRRKLRSFTAHTVRLTLATAGLGLIGVGTWPENDDPTMHGNSTGAVLIFGVISLLLIGLLWVKEQTISAVWILGCTVIAAWGGVALLVLNRNDPGRSASLGMYERMVVYAFIAGLFFIGYTLSIARRPRAKYVLRRHASQGSGRGKLLVTDEEEL